MKNNLYTLKQANEIRILRFVFDYHKLMAWSIRHGGHTLLRMYLSFLKRQFCGWIQGMSCRTNEKKSARMKRARKKRHVCVFNTSERDLICFYCLLFEPSTILPYCSLSLLHFSSLSLSLSLFLYSHSAFLLFSFFPILTVGRSNVRESKCTYINMINNYAVAHMFTLIEWSLMWVLRRPNPLVCAFYFIIILVVLCCFV